MANPLTRTDEKLQRIEAIAKNDEFDYNQKLQFLDEKSDSNPQKEMLAPQISKQQLQREHKEPNRARERAVAVKVAIRMTKDQRYERHDRYSGECDGPLRLLSKHWEDNIQKFSPSRIPELPRVTAMP
ncbi:hypothetical protein quinque_015983 [Culex quinquefasciatus]